MMDDKKKTVLLADDEKTVLLAMQFKLQRDGFNVITANDGKEAKELILLHSPHIIITDLMMPFLSGLELLNWVKKEIKQKIPVIILSVVGLERTVLEAFRLGADDFVTKPFSPKELSVRIQKHLLFSHP